MRQSVVARLRALADEREGAVALVVVAPDGTESTVSWRELVDDVQGAARLLAAAGVGGGDAADPRLHGEEHGGGSAPRLRGTAGVGDPAPRHGERDIVAVALPKGREHFAVTFAAWWLGARPLPLNPAMPAPERARIVGLADPTALVAGPDWADAGPTHVVEPGWPGRPAGPQLPPPPLDAAFAIATGGSSGVPKIILSPFPGPFEDAPQPPDVALTGRARDMVQLVNGPLFHNSPCTLAYSGLLWGHRLVVMERFDASLALDLVERHRVSFLPTVPTVMKRLLEAQARAPRDLGSIEALFHTGASCPPAVKRGWIELVGAERVHEAFGGSELIGSTFIRGDDWLRHPGSVGRPVGADVLVLDEDGHAVAPGVIGEIFLRSHRPGPAYAYLGATSPGRRPDGFESLGDLGRLSEDGFLYVADRRVDLVITGGENVYPAEVENVLLGHPSVVDAVVVGVPDPEWGHRVHAVVCTEDPSLTAATLTALCREQLSAYKVPRSVDVRVGGVLPRDPESGKIRRSAVASSLRTPR